MMLRAFKYSWMLGALLALLASLVAYDGKPNSDADLLLGYAMLALSFPSGVMMAAVFSLLGRIVYATTGNVFSTSYASIAITWLVLFVVGYAQWFVLLPWLCHKWKTR